MSCGIQCENVSYAGPDFETDATSETVVHDWDTTCATAEPLRERSAATSARLSPVEAFGVAWLLEKWVDTIGIFRDIDVAAEKKARYEAERDELDGEVAWSTDYVEKSADRRDMPELFTFVAEVLECTARELQTCGTFDALRQANDSMMGLELGERELKAEWTLSRNEALALRHQKAMHKQRYNVIF